MSKTIKPLKISSIELSETDIRMLDAVKKTVMPESKVSRSAQLRWCIRATHRMVFGATEENANPLAP